LVMSSPIALSPTVSAPSSTIKPTFSSPTLKRATTADELKIEEKEDATPSVNALLDPIRPEPPTLTAAALDSHHIRPSDHSGKSIQSNHTSKSVSGGTSIRLATVAATTKMPIVIEDEQPAKVSHAHSAAASGLHHSSTDSNFGQTRPTNHLGHHGHATNNTIVREPLSAPGPSESLLLVVDMLKLY